MFQLPHIRFKKDDETFNGVRLFLKNSQRSIEYVLCLVTKGNGLLHFNVFRDNLTEIVYNLPS